MRPRRSLSPDSMMSWMHAGCPIVALEWASESCKTSRFRDIERKLSILTATFNFFLIDTNLPIIRNHEIAQWQLCRIFRSSQNIFATHAITRRFSHFPFSSSSTTNNRRAFTKMRKCYFSIRCSTTNFLSIMLMKAIYRVNKASISISKLSMRNNWNRNQRRWERTFFQWFFIRQKLSLYLELSRNLRTLRFVEINGVTELWATSRSANGTKGESEVANGGPLISIVAAGLKISMTLGASSSIVDLGNAIGGSSKILSAGGATTSSNVSDPPWIGCKNTKKSLLVRKSLKLREKIQFTKSNKSC